MNKYAYLEELRKRLGKLSRYQVDNIVNDYSIAIGRMLDDYRDWDEIQKEIGTPKEAAKRVLEGKPMYIASDNRRGNYGNASNNGYYGNGNNNHYDAPQKHKKSRGAFWSVYFATGLVSIPLTIALGSVLLALAITAVALIISGPAAIVYAAIIGIMAASPLLFFTYFGAALLILGVGLLLLWITKQLFWPVKAAICGRKK